MICKRIVSFLNVLELICLHISIVMISTQLNDLNYCYLSLIILFDMNLLFSHSELVTIIVI